MTEAMPFLQKTILLSYDPRPLRRGRVFLFFRLFSFFLLRCHFMTGVDCHTHADQRATSEILVSLHQFLAACVEASCHTGKCTE